MSLGVGMVVLCQSKTALFTQLLQNVSFGSHILRHYREDGWGGNKMHFLISVSKSDHLTLLKLLKESWTPQKEADGTYISNFRPSACVVPHLPLL